MTDERTPAIGISCTEIQPQQPHQTLRLGQNQSYLSALARAGAAPLLIPQVGDGALLRAIYERLDALLLPGGEDVNPSLYGEPLHERCRQISPQRDEVELTLARWALSDGMPLLAICRGIQVLNVAMGGTLYQDIGAQVPEAQKHDWFPDHPRNRLSHPVTIVADTRLADAIGNASLAVNSMHHQAIKDVAPGLIVTARAPDGIVEAVEASGQPFVVGVQWHPEELAPSDVRAQQLFDALVHACYI